MSAFAVADAISTLDGAQWLPPVSHWEIATTDGAWGAHAEIQAETEHKAYRLLRGLAEVLGEGVADDGRLVTLDFVRDGVPFRAWWLRPILRWIVPERCATCPTELGAPEVPFVRLGEGRDASVICVPCRDRMHAEWIATKAGAA